MQVQQVAVVARKKARESFGLERHGAWLAADARCQQEEPLVMKRFKYGSVIHINILTL